MAVDMFLKITGVAGESTDDKHKGEIEVESFSWGAVNESAAGRGVAAGKVSMQDFHFVTQVSKASPALFLGCASGEHFKEALLTVRKAGGGQQEFLKVTMSEVLVSSYQTGASSGSELLPMDQISLNFSKVEIFYKEQRPDGTLAGGIAAGWDLKTNSRT